MNRIVTCKHEIKNNLIVNDIYVIVTGKMNSNYLLVTFITNKCKSFKLLIEDFLL